MADAVVITAPVGADSLTVNCSFGSTVVSPATLTVMVLLVCAGGEADRARGEHTAGEVGRIGRRAAAAGHRPVGAARPVVTPERVTVKVNGVLPLLPSANDALSGLIASAVGSSLRMVPMADAVVIAAPVGADSVTVNCSFGSTVVSPATLTVMVLLVCPAAKLTVPEGSTPPVKSAALAGAPPLPVTAQWRAARPGRHARAGDGEGERRAAAVAFRQRCAQRLDRQRGGVVVEDGADGGCGGDRRPGRRRQRDREALVRLDRGVAGDVDGDGLAGLPGGEADRARGQHAAGEVGRVGGRGAAAGHRPVGAARPRRHRPSG